MAVEDVDNLFAVPPEDFVRERDRLAKQLRTDRRADEADEVRRMRRPTVAVWALNQLARSHPKDVAALLAAADEVRAAQQRRAGDDLREATRRVHDRASKLAAKADGRTVELEAALRTAALAGDQGGELRAGRLQAMPEAPTDIDMWSAGVDVEPDPRPAAPKKKEDERLRRKIETARARVERLEQELADVRTRLKEAKEDLRRLEAAQAQELPT